MKSLKSICVALCAALVLSGCNWNNTAKGTAIGAGGGAALGAIVGALAGNTAIGAVIGTAVGAGAGAIIGKKMDKAKKEAEAIQNAQVEEVKDANGLDAVKVTFDSGILFSSGKSTLTASSKASLSELANVLLYRRAECPEEPGTVTGSCCCRFFLPAEPERSHCSDQERGRLR